MADTIRCREFAPRPAAWPSGKAEDCKSFTPSSNLGAAFFNGFGLKLRLISEAGLSFPPLSAGITGLAPQAMAFQQACPFG